MLGDCQDHDEAGGLRAHQEREIALGHTLTAAEHALASEACALARTFEAVGIAFDPLTFVALRIVEGSDDEHVDPVECLALLLRFGFLERTTALATDLLGEAA